MKWWLLFGIIAIMALAGGVVMTLDSVIEKMAEAIKNFEGWYPGSRSYRNNNPGNLKGAGQPGVVGKDEQGHAIFDSYESGWAALKRQLRAAFTGTSHVYNPDMTLYEFFSHYAEGNQTQYAEFVAGQLETSPDTRLGDLIV